MRCAAQILLLAALVSFGISYAEEAEGADKLSKFIEPGVIVLILVLNATVGVWMARARRRGCSGVCALASGDAPARALLTRHAPPAGEQR